MNLQQFVVTAALGVVTLSCGSSNDVLAPAPLAPTVTSVTPNSGVQGSTVAVTLAGTNFVAGATTVAVSGTGVSVSSVDFAALWLSGGENSHHYSHHGVSRRESPTPEVDVRLGLQTVGTAGFDASGPPGLVPGEARQPARGREARVNSRLGHCP